MEYILKALSNPQVKIEENIARDKRNDISLEQDGWIVIYFREKQVKSDAERCVKTLVDYTKME